MSKGEIPSRGMPWDDLNRQYNYNHPITYKRKSKSSNSNSNNDTESNSSAESSSVSSAAIEAESDWTSHVRSIAKRVAFGLTTGSMTGAAFGIVDVMRDVKTVSAKKSVAVAKVGRSIGMFGAFFGVYQGVRRICYLAYPTPVLDNCAMATLVVMPVLLFSKTFRPMLPYGIMLIALDAYNEFNDIKKT